MSHPVRHDEKALRFIIDIDGKEALLAYSQKGTVLDFYRTYVPEELRGRGLAEEVVKAGFAYAKEKGLTVRPSCPYISQTFLKRHKEYENLLDKSF